MVCFSAGVNRVADEMSLGVQSCRRRQISALNDEGWEAQEGGRTRWSKASGPPWSETPGVDGGNVCGWTFVPDGRITSSAGSRLT